MSIPPPWKDFFIWILPPPWNFQFSFILSLINFGWWDPSHSEFPMTFHGVGMDIFLKPHLYKTISQSILSHDLAILELKATCKFPYCIISFPTKIKSLQGSTSRNQLMKPSVSMVRGWETWWRRIIPPIEFSDHQRSLWIELLVIVRTNGYPYMFLKRMGVLINFVNFSKLQFSSEWVRNINNTRLLCWMLPGDSHENAPWFVSSIVFIWCLVWGPEWIASSSTLQCGSSWPLCLPLWQRFWKISKLSVTMGCFSLHIVQLGEGLIFWNLYFVDFCRVLNFLRSKMKWCTHWIFTWSLHFSCTICQLKWKLTFHQSVIFRNFQNSKI